MHHFFHEFSNWLSDPLGNLTYSLKGIPFIFAFLLGVVGTIAPCQITGNLAAIMLYSNKSVKTKVAWKEAFAFILGKIFVYTTLGILILIIGNNILNTFENITPLLRKLLGPMLVIIGLYLLGLIKLSWSTPMLSNRFSKKGLTGAFMLGAFISLGFCPTMFLIFFLTLMPIVITATYGVVLPSIFAFGTSVPLLLFLVLVSIIGYTGGLLKLGRKFGGYVQIITGLVLFSIGVFDTLVYWLA
jgi:cytochrome c-type biogenesis protein